MDQCAELQLQLQLLLEEQKQRRLQMQQLLLAEQRRQEIQQMQQQQLGGFVQQFPSMAPQQYNHFVLPLHNQQQHQQFLPPTLQAPLSLFQAPQAMLQQYNHFVLPLHNQFLQPTLQAPPPLFEAPLPLFQAVPPLFEAPLPNNGEIWHVRATNNGNANTRRKRRRSTSSHENLNHAVVPFWTEKTKELSKRLWSVRATDLEVSRLTYWSTFSRTKDCRSWYTVETKTLKNPTISPRTLWQSPLPLSQLITEREQQKEEQDEKAKAKKKRKIARSKMKKQYQTPRTRKIRIYPRQEEKKKLKQWFGVVRRAYNISVATRKAIEDGDEEMVARLDALANEVKKDKTGRPIIKVNGQGQTYFVTRGRSDALKLLIRQIERDTAEAWVLDVPLEVRDSGIRDFEKAIKSGKARNEERNEGGEEEKKEKFKFRSRKDQKQTFEIRARDFNRQSGMFAKLKECMRTKKEAIPNEADCAVRVQMNKLGQVYLCFVREVEAKSENQAPSVDGSFHSTCALDPGVRTFQAIYDADGQGIEWGKADMTQIMRLCRHADGIQSKISKKRATWQLRRAYHRVLKKIKDKVKEVHNKLALFLCENYKVVLIPKFQVSRMVKKANRKIRSKTVRQMACWSHFAFREAMKAKSELFPWCRIVEVGEAYTSKTCEECGHLHQKLGGSKNFKCPNCGHCADRDLHAARNILLRYLSQDETILQRLELI